MTKVSGLHPRDLNIGLLGPKLSQAALIVHDEDDKAVDYLSAEAIVKAWPQCQLFTTKGLGHRRILKDREVIQRVTLFISNLTQ